MLTEIVCVLLLLANVVTLVILAKVCKSLEWVWNHLKDIEKELGWIV